MSVTSRIAPLAIVLSLVGCATAPTVGQRILGTPQATVAQRQVTVAQLTGTEQQTELTRHPVMAHKAKMRRFFRMLERKHPELKDDLESLKDRLSDLSRQQKMALRASIYADIKDMTIEQFHNHIKAAIQDPTKFIAFVNKKLDRINAMSADALEDLASAPPNDIRALIRPEKSAETGEEEVTPTEKVTPTENVAPTENVEPAENAAPAGTATPEQAAPTEPVTPTQEDTD